MQKFQLYIKRYGSAMNFYGGTGESAHKQFVKAPGQKTQGRVSEFARQTAQQFYDKLVKIRHSPLEDGPEFALNQEVGLMRYLW